MIDDKQLRGGPAVRTVHGHFVNTNTSTDSRHAFVANLGASYQWDEAGGNNPNVSVGVDYRPSPQVSLSFSPSYSRAHNYAYYVTSVTDPTATSFLRVTLCHGGARPADARPRHARRASRSRRR